MHLLIILQGLSKSVEDNPSISTELSIPGFGAFSESQVNLQHGQNGWRNLLGWLALEEGYKHKIKPVGLLEFWVLGKPKEPSHQSKGRGDAGTLGTTANQIRHASSQLLQTPKRTWCVIASILVAMSVQEPYGKISPVLLNWLHSFDFHLPKEIWKVCVLLCFFGKESNLSEDHLARNTIGKHSIFCVTYFQQSENILFV